MKRIFLTLLLSGLAFQSQSQSTDTYSFSLQQCIQYAYENQAKTLNAQLDEKIATARMNELIGIGLPQVNASLGVTHYIEKPTALIPATNFDPSAPSDLYLPFQFNLTDNGQGDINLSQLIFDGSYIIGVKAARTFETLSRKQTKQTKIDVAVNVSKAYYGVLVGNARLTLLNTNIERLQKTFNDTKAMHDQGFVEQIDLDRLEIALNNLKTEKERADRLTELSIYLLKFQMGMDQKANLTLTERLEDINPPSIESLPDTMDYNKRIEYDIIKTQQTLQTLNVKRYKAGYLPSIVAFGNFGTTTNSEYFDIFRNDTRWYWNSMIGAKVSLNLFDGTQRFNKIKQETLTLQKLNNGINNLEQGIQLEYNSARRNYINSLASFEIQKKNRVLAAEVVRVTKIKYEQGVGSNLELVDAESRQREAEGNYFSSMYDAIISKIDLEKAMGVIK